MKNDVEPIKGKKKIRSKKMSNSRMRKKVRKLLRKEKQPDENAEKKTRSGCTYSPYELYLEKSEQSNISTSQANSNLAHAPLIPVKSEQKFGKPPLRLSEGHVNIKKKNPLKNETNLPRNKVTNLLRKVKDSVLKTRKQNSLNARIKISKLISLESSRKRGRKPKVANKTVGHEATPKKILPETLSNSCSLEEKNQIKNNEPMGTLKKSSEIVDKEADVIQEKNQTEVSLKNKISDSCCDLGFIYSRPSGLLNLVFPDPDPCYSLFEEVFGGGVHECNTASLLDDEETYIKSEWPVPFSTSDCMFTDTDKYKFKSCFKNIHFQIQNFDRYRGAETPGGEASLYDISEASQVDSRKFYRKSFGDLKLNMWYSYVYQSAQLAGVRGALPSYETLDNGLEVPFNEMFFTPLPTRSSRYLPGEYIWECNLKGIPSVNEVLDVE